MKITVGLVIMTSVIAISCNKNNIAIESKSIRNDKSAPPSTYSIYTDYLAVKNQIQRLCIGFAVLSNESDNTNKSTFQNILKGLRQSKSFEEEILMSEFFNSCYSNNVQFNLPNLSTDLYETAKYYINNITPATSMTAWDQDFFLGFLLSNAGSPETFQIKIDITDLNQQIIDLHETEPILVIPDIYTFPVYGFSYNNTTNTLIEILFPDENAIEDVLESNDYYVWTIGVHAELEGKEVIHDCENLEGLGVPWIQNDGYCDGNCGENLSNSPSDCNQAGNKSVYLRNIKMHCDYKNLQNSACVAQKMHYERVLSGKYEFAFSSVSLHNNGKEVTNQYVKLFNTDKSDVLRKKVKFNGVTQQRGTSISISALDKETSEEPIVSENFNPSKSKIILGFYEYDPMRPINRDEIEVSGISIGYLRWRGINITGLKNAYCTNAEIGNSPSYYKSIDFYHLIVPDPNKWQLEVDPVDPNSNKMVFKYQTTTNNDLNYELYYFVNKPSK